jgi:membrane protein
MTFREFLSLLWEAGRRCYREKADRLAAEIAFNALLAAAPLLLLLLGVASRLLGEASARREILQAVEHAAGPTAGSLAQYLMNLVPSAPGSGLAAAGGLLLMVYFSSAVFHRVRAALNTIWGVDPPPGIRPALYEWLASLLLVFASVTLVLGVLTVSLAGSMIGPFIVELFPQGAFLWRTFNAVGSFILLTIVVVVVFKRGPQLRLKVNDVIGAALLTTSLQTLANYVISRLIWHSILASLYGAAGALIVLLLWMYYSAHILLFGAAYSRAYTERRGLQAGQNPGG